MGGPELPVNTDISGLAVQLAVSRKRIGTEPTQAEHKGRLWGDTGGAFKDSSNDGAKKQRDHTMHLETFRMEPERLPTFNQKFMT